MWFTLKIYIRDRWVLASLSLALVLQAIAWSYLLVKLPPNGLPVFLHYTILSGIDLIGPAWQAYILPAAGAAMILVNYAVGFFTFNHGRFMARLIGVATVFLQVLLLIAVVFIVSLNT